MGKSTRKARPNAGERAAKLAPADAPEVKPTIAPLACPQCSAPVPLGDGDVVACPFCKAQVPVPEAYRALRDAARQDDADRAAAQALYRRIGKPPSRLFQWWANVAGVVAGVVGLVAGGLIAIGAVGGFIALFLLDVILHALRNPLGIDLIDRFGGGHVYAGLVVLMFVFLVLPMMGASYFDSFIELRKSLQAGLAARRPTQSGFPSTCRNCGAALEVPPNAYGVRCVYCQADNLVQLPHEWLKRACKVEGRFHGSIVAAVAKEREVNSDALDMLKIAVVVAAALALVFAGAGWMAADIDADWHDGQPSYRASIGPPRMLVDAGGYDPIPENQVAEWGDRAVALRNGETAVFVSTDSGCTDVWSRDTTTFFTVHARTVPFVRQPDGRFVARLPAHYTGLQIISYEGSPCKLSWHVER